jgi:hypothetical protein
MKTFVIALAAVVLVASPAMANQCPTLIKQLNDAVATKDANDPKVKQAKTLIGESQTLHDGGNHAGSVNKADEAAKLLGIELKKM